MPQEEVKVYHRCKIKKARDVGFDGYCGIDVLPDESLHHVLSFLPAREAVQTCVLARRWRHLWRSVPALRITSGPRWEWITQQEFDDLNTFMTNLLRERDLNAPLDVCELIINPFENVVKETEILKIRTWIQQALLCKAQTLRILFDEPDYSSLMLWHLHLVSHYLTTLELKCVRLGNDFLDFSSCLTLKNLRMNLCYIWSEKISSQSLKLLTIIHCWFRDHKRTRISAPNLVWLELSNNHRKTPILESMPSLVKAFVRLRDCLDHCGKEEFGGLCSKNDCINCVHNSEKHQGCVLLNGLSQAERLELVAGPGTFIFKRDLMWHPTFSKLKTLLLNEWCVSLDFCALICFLRHTPVLEKLTLQLCQAPDNWVKPRGKYVPSKEPFASKKLRVIEVKCEKFDVRVHQISRILSIYNTYLEKVTIECSERCSECYSFQKNDDLLW
ncbi:F-box/FBD/LRR-repeat protein At5g22700-like [Miscanthus floridulus]|uniref:F-box/FBD/LRR-repeat protein At5g22700-like n=1 Tax=Miscanthus floridulus TaxID=154761 RepID=UPI0034577012